MTYEIRITKDGRELATREVDADAVVALLTGGGNSPSDEKVTAPRKKATAAKKPRGKYAKKETDSDLMEHASRQHPATAEVEQLLIEGLTTAAIIEKVDISAPTVSVIRTRLRREGKLVE
jgi:hypothetical protein